MRHLRLIGVLGASLLGAGAAGAQNLGPFRQFLSVEPYYVNVQLDNGSTRAASTSRFTSLNGIGGRLWINYAPFVGSRTLAKGGIALFYEQTFKQNGLSVMHYGAEQDVFFTNRPFGGFLDPVLSVAAGAYRTHEDIAVVRGIAPTSVRTRFALTPGLGLRVPIPNRFQLRFDARDALVFNATRGTSTVKRTANNLEFTGSLGITF